MSGRKGEQERRFLLAAELDRREFLEDIESWQFRASSIYLSFQHLHDLLNKEPTVPDILRKFHDVLDARRNLGSERNAEHVRRV